MPALTDVFTQGLHADRPTPSPSIAGYFYFETDTNGGTLFQCTGSAWVQMGAAVDVEVAKEHWSFVLRSDGDTILTTDRGVLVNAASGDATLELPTSIDSDQVLTVKKIDSTASVVHLHSPYAIDDGSTTYDLTTENQAVTFATYSGFWMVVCTA